jgi:unsaturated rhamnogalacturonyl hydrolase
MRLRTFAFAGGLAGGVALVVTLLLVGPPDAGAAVSPARWHPSHHPSPTPSPSPSRTPSPSPSPSNSPSPSPSPSGGLSRAQIVATMASVDAYWIANGTGQSTNNWLNAAFNKGHLAYAATSGTSDSYTYNWCQSNGWALINDSRGEFFPDPFATGEVYLDENLLHPDPSHLAALRSRVADEVASVSAGNTSYWNFVDALNQAAPSLARLGVLDGNTADLSTMDTLFNYAESHLYSSSASLWWRDGNYVGTTTYWSRGNGWAAMAMAKVLEALPASDTRRAQYQSVLVSMAAALKATQRSDGFWNVDLGDPTDYPGPETSGTAFFTYALTWGINHGVLPAATYRPVVEKAWQGMVSIAVHSNGLLGYVQATGSKPSDHQPVGYDDTTAFGVGGFLLAGSQLAALEG